MIIRPILKNNVLSKKSKQPVQGLLAAIVTVYYRAIDRIQADRAIYSLRFNLRLSKIEIIYVNNGSGLSKR